MTGAGTDQLLGRTGGGFGATDWYLTDAQGSVRRVIDSVEGSPQGSASYDATGNRSAGSSTNDRFGYTSRDWDQTVGLQYNRARYYDPELGRWTQEDPIGFGGGDMNLYRYVGNSPVNYTDPSGLRQMRLPDEGDNREWGDLAQDPKYNPKGQGSFSGLDLTHSSGLGGRWYDYISPGTSLIEIGLAWAQAYSQGAALDEKLRQFGTADPNPSYSVSDSAGGQFGLGLGQGVANTGNGLQDAAVESFNLAQFGPTNLALWMQGRPTIGAPSPDWSKDLIVYEDETGHAASKFLGANGVLALIPGNGGIGWLRGAFRGAPKGLPAPPPIRPGVNAPIGVQRVGTGGLRNEIPLTVAQQAEARGIALELGATDDMIRFSDNMNTGYGNLWEREVLYIGSDVLPAANPGRGGMTANSRLTMRATLAHELYGHRSVILAGRGRAIDGQISVVANALEEAEASIRAARFAPGLSATERYTLLRDAMGRLRNQRLSIRDVRDQLWIIEP